MRHTGLAFVVLAALLLAGCQHGCTAFGGDVGGVGFDPNGTVFSYADEFDDGLASDPRPRAAVVMTWIVFNPQADLGDIPGDDLEEMRHEMKIRDAAAIVFAEQADVVAGAAFDSVREGDTVLEDEGADVRLHFAPERLTPSSTYASFQPFGSLRSARVTIDGADFTPGSVSAGVSGTVRVEVERTDADPADARIGVLEGTFNAPLVEERIAESNLAVLESEPLLGVPLAPASDDDDEQNDDEEGQ